MIKLIIFDLDSTLFDNRGQIGITVLNEMIRRMLLAGLDPKLEPKIREMYPSSGFLVTAQTLGLDKRIIHAGLEAYENMELDHIKPFDDVSALDDLKQEKILVSSGVKKMQLKKVEILGLEKHFTEIIIDESKSIKGKTQIFYDLMRQRRLESHEVLAVGDNPDSEIASGMALGMVTVQILRTHVCKGFADYYIICLDELHGILITENKKIA